MNVASQFDGKLRRVDPNTVIWPSSQVAESPGLRLNLGAACSCPHCGRVLYQLEDSICGDNDILMCSTCGGVSVMPVHLLTAAVDQPHEQGRQRNRRHTEMDVRGQWEWEDVVVSGEEHRLLRPTQSTSEPIEAHVVWGGHVIYDHHFDEGDPVQVYELEDVIQIVDAEGLIVGVVCPECNCLTIFDQRSMRYGGYWECSTDECHVLISCPDPSLGQVPAGTHQLCEQTHYRLSNITATVPDGDTAVLVDQCLVVRETDFYELDPVLVYENYDWTHILRADGAVAGFVCPRCGRNVLLDDSRVLQDGYRSCSSAGCDAVVACYDHIQEYGRNDAATIGQVEEAVR